MSDRHEISDGREAIRQAADAFANAVIDFIGMLETSETGDAGESTTEPVSGSTRSPRKKTASKKATSKKATAKKHEVMDILTVVIDQ